MSKFKLRGNSSLDKLEILTKSLPKFPIKINESCVDGANMEQYKMECGTSLAWNLINQPEISAARWFNSAGSVFPEHVHEEKEWLIVYSGEMFLKVDGEERALKPSDFAYIEPFVKHGSRFDQDTWFLAITIPASEAWPK